jgi:hypothetical protein
MKNIIYKYCRPLNVIALSALGWGSSMSALFGGKTELELNGIGVIKESAEILAKTAETLAGTFPTYKMAIAMIGLITFSQGLYFLVHGFISLLCGDSRLTPEHKSSGRLRGFALFIIGLCLATCGASATLFSSIIVMHIFGS